MAGILFCACKTRSACSPSKMMQLPIGSPKRCSSGPTSLVITPLALISAKVQENGKQAGCLLFWKCFRHHKKLFWFLALRLLPSLLADTEALLLCQEWPDWVTRICTYKNSWSREEKQFCIFNHLPVLNHLTGDGPPLLLLGLMSHTRLSIIFSSFQLLPVSVLVMYNPLYYL